MTTAREVAYDVLAAVRDSDAYANLLLPSRIERAGLSTADAALATELTYGTLRLQGYYDKVIELAAKRGVEDIDPPILDVLRLGTHQLLGMRVATHAAVNESVEAARRVGSRSAIGFTNGVLRSISRSSAEDWRARVVAGTRSDDERLSVLHSHPVWIIRAFRRALAVEGRADELESLLEADNEPPRVNLTALPGLAEPPVDAELDAASPFGFVSAGGDPHSLVTRSGGRYRVQDEGSQLAALALVAARPVEEGERWLDLCSGPGGKAALLGAIALQTDARLVANELIPARSDLVRASVAPVEKAGPGTIELTVRDGRSFASSDPGGFDRILLDAPCTGLGALRRRPEARWRKQPKDVAELSTLQGELLDAAITALAPGGVLAYVTCSPHLGETRAAVGSALASHPDISELDTAAALRGITRSPLDLASDGPSVQLWPHRNGTDAMFIALLTKRL
jgi:16S rRNA (cytosine967-C5)-methyltransferase